MNDRFTIKFDFPLEGSSLTIPLLATVEPNVPQQFYCVHSFSSPTLLTHDKTHGELLPAQYLTCILEKNVRKWVHTDSSKETTLSIVIGEAIDKSSEEH